MLDDTVQAIHRFGHRRFIGGGDEYWDLIGELQFRFLLAQGLKPSDVLIDVACGSLRGGVKFINYLEPDHYLGIDKFIELIIYGTMRELGDEAYVTKRPRFYVSDGFEFDKLDTRPTFAIAQSLFSHLCAEDIALCLGNLRTAAAPGCRFFATFFEVPEPVTNPEKSHSQDWYGYTRKEMEKFGQDAGWRPNYIGDWNHPRQQHIIEYIAS